MIEIDLLGPLVVRVDGRPTRIPGRHERTIIVALVLAGDAAIDSDRLTDILWPDEPPADPRHAIETHISRIRRVLGSERVRSTDGGYRLDQIDVVDALRFEADVEAGRTLLAAGSPGEAVRRFELGLSRWRGPILGELGERPFIVPTRLRLDELRIFALEASLEARVEMGGHDEAIPMLVAFVAEHPLRERARGTLMLALYRAGRQAAALAEYHVYRTLIDDSLGLDPSSVLDQRYRAILVQDPSLDGPEVSVALHRAADRLPVVHTSFVGRDREVGRIRDMLAATRLLTLVGPGGTGKTRLALEVAAGSAIERRDGAWFVPLDLVTEGEAVAAVAATALDLRIPEGRSALDAIRQRLVGSDALIVLDNGEHVADAAAELARAVLEASEATSVLATSRSRLRLASEVVASVPPMDQPDPGDAPDAILATDGPRLFVERARTVGPAGVVRHEDAAAIAAICQAVDGLPLGIELAAGLTRTLTIPEIRERILETLDVAASGSRDLPERHHSLRATTRWSLELLDTETRSFLARLAVFASWADIPAIEAVTATSPDRRGSSLATLAELGDRSLIVREVVDDVSRFRLLSTVRAVVRDELLLPLGPSILAEVHGAHARYFTARADAVDGTASDRTTALWVRDTERAMPDCLAAIDWSLGPDGDPQAGLRLSVALGRVWEWRGQAVEGESVIRRALDATPDAPPDVRGGGWLWLGYFAWRTDRQAAGRTAVAEALAAAALAGDDGARAGALGILSLLDRSAGDTSGAERAALEANAIWATVGDAWAVAYTDILACRAALAGGRLSAAETHAERAVARYDELGYGRGTGWSQVALALIRLEQGRPAEARTLARGGLEAARELNDPDTEAECLEILARLAGLDADVAGAAELRSAAARVRLIAGGP